MESFIPGQLKPRLTANPSVAQRPRAVPLITMGIKGLTKLLADQAPRCMVERTFDSYSGRKVAIDASMSIYQFLAPGEAEAECAALCKSGKVYAVSSEDMDALTFGSPKLLRYLLTPASRKLSVLELDLSMVLDNLNLSMDQFVDVCILCGCDYCETIKGIGPQKALKLVREHGGLECVLESINKDRYRVPDLWPFEEVRRLFKDPLVTAPEDQCEPQWADPDEEDLRSFLVDQNSFNPVRVTKAIDRIKTIRDKLL